MAWIENTAEAAALIHVDPSTMTMESIGMAAFAVEAFINREVEDIPAIGARDLRKIKKSIALQAKFLEDQPDYMYRTLIESASADGQQFTMVKAAGGGVDIAAQMLHPLVVRMLMGLSWKRKAADPASNATLIESYRSFLNEASDQYSSNWKELK